MSRLFPRPLSAKQLAALGSVSQRAFRHLQQVGFPVDDYDAWRHEVTADACEGRSSWRTLTQSDYIPLFNAFVAFYGGKQRVDRTPKTAEEARAWCIRDTMAVWEQNMAYVAKVIAGKTRRPWIHAGMTLHEMLAGLSLKQISEINMTLNKRGRDKHKRESEALGIPAFGRPHTSPATVPPGDLPEFLGDERPQEYKPRCRRKSSTPQAKSAP